MVDVEKLETKARILAGYDDGTERALTADERNEMLSWGSAELGYDPHEAPGDDERLSQWFLGALNAYVQDKCG